MYRKGFSIIVAFFCFVYSYGQNIIHTEMLGRPTNTSISVKAIFDTVVEARVSYGTQSGTFPGHTSWQLVNQDSTGEAVEVINLTNLISDTQYFYKLQYRKPGDTSSISRPQHSFHTARAPGETFTFVIQADPHLDAASDTALYRLCLHNQLDDNPDFMIDLGDFLMTDKLKNNGIVPEDTIPYRCKLLRSYYETVNHSVPLFNVLGNHEGEEGWYLNGTSGNVAVWDTKYRKKYFMNPVPDNFYTGDTSHVSFVGQREAYYAWTWGDALFVVLDPFWYTTPKPDSLHCWRWTLGKPQYDWLKSTLENSPSKFKFVFIHNLFGGIITDNGEGRGGVETAGYYEWGGKNKDSTDGWAANRPGWYKPIKDLLKEHEVTAVFHGHDHLFAKQEMGCLLYQEVPQPSLPNFTNVTQAIDYGYLHGVIIPNSGHLRVTVSPAGVTVDYVRAVRPSQQTASLHNKDISETYFINMNCYDSLQGGINSKDNDKFNIITVYPNPTNNSLVVQSETPKSYNRPITLINMMGETVSTGALKSGDTSVRLNISEISSGVYFVKISDNINSSVFKITISKR